MKNRVIVEIGGREFALIADESESYMKSIALEVNKMINEAVHKSIRTSRNDAALLICLELCDKNKKLNEVNDNMRKQIAEYIEENERLKRNLIRPDSAVGADGESEAEVQAEPQNCEEKRQVESGNISDSENTPKNNCTEKEECPASVTPPQTKTEEKEENKVEDAAVQSTEDIVDTAAINDSVAEKGENIDVSDVNNGNDGNIEDTADSPPPAVPPTIVPRTFERKETSVESLKERFNKLQKNMSK